MFCAPLVCLQRDGFYRCEVVHFSISIYNRQNNRVIYDAIDDSAAADGVWYLAPEKDDQSDMTLWFSLKPEHFDKFNADQTELEEQESILRAFVLEVLSFISMYFQDDPIRP